MTPTTVTPGAPASDYSPQDAKLARRVSRRQGLCAPDLLKTALRQAFLMLRPDIQWKNPVMFVVEVGTVLTVLFTIAALLGHGGAAPVTYLIALDVWLFLTVLFANFASALAEARGKAQADALRKTRQETPAYRVRSAADVDGVMHAPGMVTHTGDGNGQGPRLERTVSTALAEGDLVVIEAGQ